MRNTVFYSYNQYADWMQKIIEITNGKFYTKLWQGFLNYYSQETGVRVGYEVIQGGYYLIIRE